MTNMLAGFFSWVTGCPQCKAEELLSFPLESVEADFNSAAHHVHDGRLVVAHRREYRVMLRTVLLEPHECGKAAAS